MLFATVFLFADSHQISYIYTSDGRKIASAIDGSFTYYRNTLQYQGESKIPEKVLHPEGFVDFMTNTYKYFKTDHLGNVRVLLAVDGYSDDEQQALIAEQNTDYYPFGLAHGQYENLHLNRFLFSGKELQDAPVGAHGMLGWYDFGFRHYNPLLGHWMTPDILAQFENPYLYCMNDPVNFVDPNGLWGYSLIDGVWGRMYNDANDPYGAETDVVHVGHIDANGNILSDNEYVLSPGNCSGIRESTNIISGQPGAPEFNFTGFGSGSMVGESASERGFFYEPRQSQHQPPLSRFQLDTNPVVQAIYRGQRRFWGTAVDLGFYTMDKMSTGVTALGVITAPIGIGGPLMATGGIMSFASGWYNGLQAINAGNTYSGVYQIGMSTIFSGFSWGLSRFMTLNQSAFFELYLAPFSYITNQTSNKIHY